MVVKLWKVVVEQIIVDAHILGRSVRKEPLLISFTNEKLPRAYFQSLLSAEFITLGKNGLVFSECFLLFADDLLETSLPIEIINMALLMTLYVGEKM